ncbi:ABC transporter substrate-binding protein [Chitinasiproducens palmae]|uniref:Amino acid ABC transporter substrate-binding protein, PAAT family n=1 Tax=Chitinasiproducens palmae TaxID=1770053 RepID=A0A1H2PKQ3_9BURK|nr:ABC transporter substrate-binding protein [Chitinasiproducens palmae]SDV47043.1 amino acid ABC transporter substrate-binding protein, PAAT family [Chitinasiproducens palmae]
MLKQPFLSTRAMRAAVVALGAFAFSFGAAHADAADSLSQIRSSGTIRIANTQSSPPWSMLGADNRPEGYDVAVAQELAKRLQVPKVVFVADSFKNFVEGLKTGKYDLVMNDLTPTPEREKQVDFGAPYGVEQFRIFVRNDSRIASRADLKGKRVGVSTGSSNESWAKAHLTDSSIRSYDNGALIFNDLGVGRLDAVIISHFGGMKYANVNHLPVKEVGEPLTYQLSAPAMAKGQPELRRAVNDAIASMLADGTIARLSQRWVGNDYDMVGSIAAAQKE